MSNTIAAGFAVSDSTNNKPPRTIPGLCHTNAVGEETNKNSETTTQVLENVDEYYKMKVETCLLALQTLFNAPFHHTDVPDNIKTDRVKAFGRMAELNDWKAVIDNIETIKNPIVLQFMRNMISGNESIKTELDIAISKLITNRNVNRAINTTKGMRGKLLRGSNGSIIYY